MPKAAEEKSTVLIFKVAGKDYSIDVGNSGLTWGEIEEAERYFEESWDYIDRMSGRFKLFMAYLAMKRAKPTTTLDDLRELTLEQIEEVDAPRPTKRQSATAGAQSS